MRHVERILGAGLIGVAGAATMAAMAGGVQNTPMILAALVGASLIGLGTAGFFGKPDGPGVLAACAGAVIATLGGAAIAGLAVGLPIGFPGAMFVAPIAVAAEIVTSPLTALTWLGCMAGTHAVMWVVRAKAARPYSRK
jgi:hypothetical protein